MHLSTPPLSSSQSLKAACRVAVGWRCRRRFTAAAAAHVERLAHENLQTQLETFDHVGAGNRLGDLRFVERNGKDRPADDMAASSSLTPECRHRRLWRVVMTIRGLGQADTLSQTRLVFPKPEWSTEYL